MQSTTRSTQRFYCVQLWREKNDWPPVIRVKADCMTMHEQMHHITFQRNEHNVGEVYGNIAAWWIEEEIVNG